MRTAFAMLLALSIALSVLSLSIYLLAQQYAIEPTGFKRVVFYYGWLNTSNVLDIDFDILVFSATTGSTEKAMVPILRQLKDEKPGVEVYGYLHDGDSPIGLGSTFNTMVVSSDPTCSDDSLVSRWISYIERVIDTVVDRYSGLIDGLFLDEVDPSYFGYTDPNHTCVQKFSYGVREVVSYIKSRGLKVFINGVRAYAHLGDYYLWENFVTIYDPDTGSYTIDPHFFDSQDNGNPYEWENGLAKYLWLRDNGLLSKTIALSYVPRDDPDRYAIYGYLAARILGLAGWAFADIEVFSSGGSIRLPQLYELGTPITDPEIFIENKTLRRVFASGTASVVLDPSNPEAHHPFEDAVYPRIEVDGYRESYYSQVASGVNGVHSTIIDISYVLEPQKLYLYIEAEWSTEPIDGLLHIYVDYDGDSETGYRIHGVGADYLVEVYTTLYMAIYRYTGTGSDWSWEEVSNRRDEYIVKKISDIHYVFEMMIPTDYIVKPNISKLVFTTIIKQDGYYVDDAVYSALTNMNVLRYTPILYEDVDLWREYYAVIADISISRDRVTLVTEAPTGTWIYRIAVPFKDVAKVLKNGTELAKVELDQLSSVEEGWAIEFNGSNYLELCIKVKHMSSAVITILAATPQAIGSSGGSALGGTANAFNDIAIYVAVATIVITFYTMYCIEKRAREQNV